MTNHEPDPTISIASRVDPRVFADLSVWLVERLDEDGVRTKIDKSMIVRLALETLHSTLVKHKEIDPCKTMTEAIAELQQLGLLPTDQRGRKLVGRALSIDTVAFEAYGEINEEDMLSAIARVDNKPKGGVE